MPFPKLTQLQSRFAASLAASLILLAIYLSLTKPHFAYAIELESRIPEDHNHPVIFEAVEVEGDVPGNRASEEESVIRERQVVGLLYLSNNQPQNKDIAAGDVQNWVFTKESINGPPGERGKGLPKESSGQFSSGAGSPKELKKRQSTKQVYVSINTCSQPKPGTSNTSNLIAPQLSLYYSSSNVRPGPTSMTNTQNISLDAGYALINITTNTDFYVGVAASTTDIKGFWNYEIAASIDAPFHTYNNDSLVHFVDSDTHASLFITTNLTDADPNSQLFNDWMSLTPPFGMFGHDQKDPTILGVSKSYCGLRNNARLIANLERAQNQNVASMTSRGIGAKPKEQFYLTSLNASSSYWGFMAMQGNSTASGLNVVGGGGTVWAMVDFNTKSESNCALMYNLTFCSEIAYAVPTNPDLFSPRGGLPELAKLYDDSARQLYQYFNYSLQQIPCDTSDSAQYSLARNCTDCANAYKQWLCAVTIPRCADFGNPAAYLKPRNVAQAFPNGTFLRSTDQSQILWTMVSSNQSRNALIDNQIKPGPYKEVLPCEDLCYDLVQSCPAALGFGCPSAGAGLEDSYGTRSGNGSEITCSWLGAAYYLTRSGASRGVPGVAVGLVTSIMGMWILLAFGIGFGL